MSQLISIQQRPSTLTNLKLAFEKYRENVSDKKIIYTDDLRILAAEALKEFSYYDVHCASGVSLSSLSKWRSARECQAALPARKVLVVRNSENTSYEARGHSRLKTMLL